MQLQQSIIARLDNIDDRDHVDRSVQAVLVARVEVIVLDSDDPVQLDDRRERKGVREEESVRESARGIQCTGERSAEPPDRVVCRFECESEVLVLDICMIVTLN